MSTGFDHFYRGKLINQGVTTGEFQILASTPGITHVAAEMFEASKFGQHNKPRNWDAFQGGIGFLPYTADHWILAYARPSKYLDRGHRYPDYHNLVVPRSYADVVLRNLRSVAESLYSSDAPSFPVPDFDLDKQTLHGFASPPDETHQIEQLSELNRRLPSPQVIGTLIDLILSDRPVAILQAPYEFLVRIDLVQALLCLFPSAIRPNLSFATHVFHSETCRARLKFLYNDPLVRSDPERDVEFVWSKSMRGESAALALSPYAQFVATYWDRGVDELFHMVNTPTADRLVANLMRRQPNWTAALRGLGLYFLIFGAELRDFVARLRDATALMSGVDTVFSGVNQERLKGDLESLKLLVNAEARSFDPRLITDLRDSAGEFARLILELADERTKPSLLTALNSKSADQIAQKLRRGEILPQNGYDFFEVLRGFLSGDI